MMEKIVYLLALILIAFFRLLPFDFVVWLGSFCGRLFHTLDRRHRLLALDNLRKAFKGNKTEQQLKELVRKVYQNLGRSGMEFIRLSKMNPSAIHEMTEIEGLEYYKATIAENRGVIVLAAHFGNWEWIPTALGSQGVPMHIIVRPVDNPYLDGLLQSWRERYGNVVMNKRTETGSIIKLLRAGKSIGFLLDQNIGREKAVFVDYFGRPAATNKALATIALRTGAPVVPIFIIRKKRGHKIVIEKPMHLPRTGVLKDDLIEITGLFTKKIESYVQQYPDHWLWLHRRWKTQPEPSERKITPDHG